MLVIINSETYLTNRLKGLNRTKKRYKENLDILMVDFKVSGIAKILNTSEITSYTLEGSDGGVVSVENDARLFETLKSYGVVYKQIIQLPVGQERFPYYFL